MYAVFLCTYSGCPIILAHSFVLALTYMEYMNQFVTQGAACIWIATKSDFLPIFDASKLKLSPGNQAFYLRHFEVTCYSLLTNSHCYLGKWWEYSWDSRQLWWSGLSCRTYTALETSSFQLSRPALTSNLMRDHAARVTHQLWRTGICWGRKDAIKEVGYGESQGKLMCKECLLHK